MTGNLDVTPCLGTEGPRFLHGEDWQAAGYAGLIALMLYVATMAPTVTLEFSGALGVAGDQWGIGKVPGFPLWHILANLFTRVFGFVTYHGHPNPAWALNFMSVVFGAGCCGLVSLLVNRTARMLVAVADDAVFCCRQIPAVTAGVLFAASPVMWSQSVITETHSLTCFLILLNMVVLFRWLWRPSNRMALLAALLFGLGLAQSHLVIVLIPVCLLVMLMTDGRLFIGMLVFSGMLWCFLAALSWVGFAMAWWPALGFALLLMLFVSLRFLPHGRLILGMMLLVLIGLSLYLYLPLASMGNPPMNWGYTRTWEGFCHVVSRGQYERLMLVNPFRAPGVWLRQSGLYVRLLCEQYFSWLTVIGLLPFVLLWKCNRVARCWLLVVALALILLGPVVTVQSSPKWDVQTLMIVRKLLIPSFACYAVLLGVGLTCAVDAVRQLFMFLRSKCCRR